MPGYHSYAPRPTKTHGIREHAGHRLEDLIARERDAYVETVLGGGDGGGGEAYLDSCIEMSQEGTGASS